MTSTRPCIVLFTVVLAAAAASPRRPRTSTGACTTSTWPAAAMPSWIRITVENVHLLAPRWLFQHGVIDGVSNRPRR